MAKDDYFVIAYRILAYLYACLKTGQRANIEYLTPGSREFPVGESYWSYIFEHLYKDGYIEGVMLIPILGQQEMGVKLSPDIRITPKGIEYLEDNSAMQKAKKFLKELKEIVPGL